MTGRSMNSRDYPGEPCPDCGQMLGPGTFHLHPVVTPSRTDRQPPTSAAGAKGGETPVAPATTNHPDLVTHHEET